MTTYAIWHHRDTDGFVQAVYASPESDLYAAMRKVAQDLADSAKDGVTAEIDESQEGSITVEFRATNTQESEEGYGESGYSEYDLLLPGAPSQPFDTVHVTDKAGDTTGTIEVAQEWETWSKVPDEFDHDEEVVA